MIVRRSANLAALVAMASMIGVGATAGTVEASPNVSPPGLGGTKIGASDWVNSACAIASSLQNVAPGCVDPNCCMPLVLGIPQGAAAGVVAPGAAATFTLSVPVDFIPVQLILSGGATALQVTDMHTALNGPMIAGAATSPIGGDLFGANVQEPFWLVPQKVSTSQNILVSVQNPTLANITFVGAIKGLRAC